MYIGYSISKILQCQISIVVWIGLQQYLAIYFLNNSRFDSAKCSLVRKYISLLPAWFGDLHTYVTKQKNNNEKKVKLKQKENNKQKYMSKQLQ